MTTKTLEDFALAPDRDKILESLIPGTEEYYWLKCLHLQNLGRHSEVAQQLALWIERHGRTQRVQEMLRRDQLLRYEQAPAENLEQIRLQLNLQFDHQRQVEGSEAPFPSALDPETLSREALSRYAFDSHPQDLAGFSDMALDWLVREPLDPNRRRALLQRLTRPDHPNLIDLICADLDYPNSSGFGSFQIHKLLTLEQLDELAARKPAVLSVATFVHVKLLRLRPGPDIYDEHNPVLRGAYLERLWSFAQTLSASFNPLKVFVLFHKLSLDRTIGKLDRNLFLEYLKLPRQTSWMEPRYLERREFRDVQSRGAEDYSSQTGLSAIGDDWPLVRALLSELFVDAASWEPFDTWVRDTLLKPVFAEAKILAGKEDRERWYSVLGDPAAYQAVKERVDIEFSPTVRRRYSASENVQIEVELKNVPSLVVKVFEINTLNYYLARGQEVDASIDLDGLVAREEKTYTFDVSPFQRIRRVFDFESLAKPGVYVLEFLGKGRASRALIRKGFLRCVDRVGGAGHEFTISDEQGQVLSDASLWLGAREYKPSEDGTILVPFSTRPGQQAILLKHGDLTTLAWFEHRGEDYSLAAGIHVERESLVRGNKATALVRPALSLNGVPVSLSLLQDVSLAVESVDLAGVQSSKEIRSPVLTAEEEYLVELQVPEDLVELSFTLRAKVKSLTQAKDLDLSARRSFTLNGIDRTNSVVDLHLAKTTQGYLLYVLGKNGEPRKDVVVNCSFHLLDYGFSWVVSLKSDAKGRIELGPLDRVYGLEATTPDGVTESFSLLPDNGRFPQYLRAREGEPIEIRCPGSSSGRAAFSLLETRKGIFLRDCFEFGSLSEETLCLRGLSAGDYDLWLKDANVRIFLQVVPGVSAAGWVLGEVRQVEERNPVPLQIAPVEVTDSEILLRIMHAGPLTRVHLFGTKLLPSYSGVSNLALSGLPSPRESSVRLPTCDYISGRDLGDEYRYILERKQAKTHPGNMLPRPGLLLNPWPVRKTDTSKQDAKPGEAYAAKPPPPPCAAAPYSSAAEIPKHAAGEFSTLDFLASTAVLRLNLRPEEGILRIPRSVFAECHWLQILAVDHLDLAVRRVALPEQPLRTQDLRLSPGLDPHTPCLERKDAKALQAGESLAVERGETSKRQCFDTVARVYGFYSTQTQNETLREFGFVARWNELSRDEKRTTYSRYACHELSFFLAHKDRAFFQEVIVPYLRNKKDKTFLDRYLLEEDLSKYLDPWAWGRLNIVERILLGKRLASDRGPSVRYLEDKVDRIPADIERDNRLFLAVLGGTALEPAEDAFCDSCAPEEQDRAAVAGFGAAAPSFAAAPAPAQPAPQKLAKAKSARGYADGDYLLREERDASKRGRARALYRALDTTEELAENHYYKLPLSSQGPELVTVNAFWLDFARHDGTRPFLSARFALATSNFTEMMLALSVLDLPFQAEKLVAQSDGPTQTLKASSPMVVFHKAVQPAPLPEKPSPILVSQEYFRLDDPYEFENGEQVDKCVQGELLVQVAYQCRVVVTNPSSAPQKLELLLQIPSGSLPVQNGFRTKGHPLRVEPHGTASVEYSFYFPEPGDFPHFPVHVSKDNELLAAAEPTTLHVVARLSTVDTKSWPWLSQQGDTKEVLTFLEEKNLEGIDLTLIAWRMSDKAFYERVLALLASRHLYDGVLWSYSLFHNDPRRLREFLAHQEDFLRGCGKVLRSRLADIDPVERGWYEHHEFAPLVNARAHALGGEHKILNDRFKQQYDSFLEVLCYRPELTSLDWLELAYYLFLQERVEEGVAAFSKVDFSKVPTQLQGDYLRAYIAFHEGHPEKAREIAEARRQEPVDRWRKLFEGVCAQSEEIAGGAAVVVEPENKTQVQASLAATEPSFEFTVESRTVKLHWRNLTECRFNYYRMDIELLFSRQPFLQRGTEQFAFITPNRSDTLALPSDQGSLQFDLPGELANANVVVEGVAAGLRKSQAYYANDLLVHVIETYGQIKATQRESGAPAVKAYVKCYARMRDGSVRFYKDGYTDLRGRFDYASLSTSDLDQVDRFALLVLEDSLGAVIQEAGVPKR